jgi:hypothetical protein
MKLQIPIVRDAGNLSAERLVMRVSGATDIGEFIAFRSGVENGIVTTNVTHVFWFPDQSIRSGDIVVLYTKAGIQKQRVNRNGYTSHFFYWGLTQPVWDNANYAAVVAHIDEWNSTLIDAEEPDEGAGSTPADEAQRA